MKQKHTVDMVRQHCHPVFQHQYALSRLKDAGYKLAVCSNSIRQSLELMMQRAGLDRFLDVMLSNEDVTNAKPDPEIYRDGPRAKDLLAEYERLRSENESLWQKLQEL